MVPIVGIADHTGWAVAVVADGAGSVLASRRLALVGEGLPSMPHHGAGQRLPLFEGVALVEQVTASAAEEARLRLAELANLVPALGGIALRSIPRMPDGIAATLQDYWAQTRADGVMYRRALAAAATERGWEVHWFDAKLAAAAATERLGSAGLAKAEAKAREEFGPPWTADHRMALHAAVSSRGC